MRICYIGDGNSVHVQRWVGWFGAHHEVTLISTTHVNGSAPYPVVNLPQQTAPATRLARSVREVRRVAARLNPDIVHSHYINEAGWLGAASLRRPFILTAWGSDVYRAPHESTLARYLNPYTARRADALTCDSRDQARVMSSWGIPAARISVIGWGVDLSEFDPGVADGRQVRQSLGIPAEARVVLSPRQWLKNSNIPAVVAAHERLPQDVYLLLKRMPQHEGEAGLAVERLIAHSPARERIRVVGAVEPSRLPALYGAADIVISLCTTDGTPASLLEAMAMRLPVVALRNESVAEWISDPGGKLVNSLDPQEIEAALRSYLDAAARPMAGEHNRQVVSSRGDRAAEFARMEEIYRSVHPGRQDT